MLDPNPQQCIAILANPRLAHGRNILRGAVRYAREHALDVRVDLLTREAVIALQYLQSYDGIITAMEEPMLRELPGHIPVVRFDEFVDGRSPSELPLPHDSIGVAAAA